MKIIEKDILTVEKGIICQQVNCRGVMGSGLAKAIREKWPIVYDNYMYEMEFEKHYSFTKLGTIFWARINEDLLVCNIFGQLNYGNDGKRYTDYSALNTAFCEIKFKFTDYATCPQIYFPFNFGCDRGGADWNIVNKMIDYYFPNAIICKLPDAHT